MKLSRKYLLNLIMEQDTDMIDISCLIKEDDKIGNTDEMFTNFETNINEVYDYNLAEETLCADSYIKFDSPNVSKYEDVLRTSPDVAYYNNDVANRQVNSMTWGEFPNYLEFLKNNEARFARKRVEWKINKLIGYRGFGKGYYKDYYKMNFLELCKSEKLIKLYELAGLQKPTTYSEVLTSLEKVFLDNNRTIDQLIFAIIRPAKLNIKFRRASINDSIQYATISSNTIEFVLKLLVDNCIDGNNVAATLINTNLEELLEYRREGKKYMLG